MFDTLKKVKKAFHVQTRREREEAYLAQSHDRFDLEHRMRRLDRGDVIL